MKFAIIALLIFGLGGCLGARTGPEREVEFVKIRQPAVTVTAEPEPQPTEYVVPESCQSAIDEAARLANLAEKMYVVGDDQLDIISDARRLTASGLAMAPIEERQRVLQGKTIGRLADLSESLQRYTDFVAECDGDK